MIQLGGFTHLLDPLKIAESLMSTAFESVKEKGFPRSKKTFSVILHTQNLILSSKKLKRQFQQLWVQG